MDHLFLYIYVDFAGIWRSM